VYDLAVFMTESEYLATSEEAVSNLQQLIEEPELYIVALSSSSPSDQLAIIPDRVDDLLELSDSIGTSHGIEITDTLRFFIGDHPAQQFERSTQVGGTYKCGSCGCPDSSMDDFARAGQCKWRSLADLQSLVLAGKHGSKVGTLKAFSGLKVAELREELHSRGVWDTDVPKQHLERLLNEILMGAQRVPSLLISDPKQALGDLNIADYEIIDCEPLHDLKGHLHHLLTELPHILTGGPQIACQDLLQNVLFSRKEGGYTGADLRVALLEVFKLLHCQDVDADVKLLLQTGVYLQYYWL